MKKIFFITLIFCILSDLEARGTSSAITVEPYFNFGFISPSDINEKITMSPGGINTFMPESGTIRWARNFGTYAGYRFNHRYNIGLVFDYVSFGKFISGTPTSGQVFQPKSPTLTNAGYYEFNSGASAFSLGPAFYYTIYSGGKLGFDAGLGLLYAPRVKYFEDVTYGTSVNDPNINSVNLSQMEGSGSAFGFMLNTSTTYYITNYLGLALNLGYRYLKCSSLKDSNGNVMKFRFNNGTYDSTNMTINLSGLYFGFGLKIDFNIDSSTTATAKGKTDEGWVDYGPAGTDFNSDWSAKELSTASTVEQGPTIQELRGVKKQVQRKYNEAKINKDPESQAKTERYQKLYDITNRLEADWDKFSAKSRADKLEKIKIILSR